MSRAHPRFFDALGAQDRREMHALLRELAAAVRELTALGIEQQRGIAALDRRVNRLEVRASAHRTLLRSLPVSAWPPMMAGEFVALWEGEDE